MPTRSHHRRPGGHSGPVTLRRTAAVAFLALSVAGLEVVRGQDAGDRPPLAAREAELLRRYTELERSFLRLADLLSSTDPRRAAVLREAFDRAREEEVGERLGRIVALLEEGQLLEAGTRQSGAIEQFRELLQLLEAGAGDRTLTDTKQEVRAFLGRIAKLISRQRDLAGSTEGAGDAARLSERQQTAAEEAETLAGDLGQFAERIDASPSASTADGRSADETAGEESSGGEPAGGNKPPSDRAAEGDAAPAEDQPIDGDDEAARARRTRQGITAAERRMRAARDQLENARRREAREEQERAIEALETARAQLEEILRQLREEEVERLLVNLEARIRTLLRMERGVQSATEKLVAARTISTRERQLEAARIGREQQAVTAELGRALAVVRDDGTAVAIPKALEQVEEDSRQAAARFTAGELGPETLGLVGDILAGLEELLAALETSQREEEAGSQPGPGGGRPAEPGEQPLVDKLAELKMLRSLQVRVNARTERFARLLDAGAEAAAEPALIEALQRLAERQRAIERAAADIVAGRTE